MLSNFPELAPTDALQQPYVSNNQPDLFILPLHNKTASQINSLELPQISFTSSIFANFNERATQLPEED